MTERLTPHYYQRDAVDATNEFMSDGRGNPLVVIPPGGGKSLIMATHVQEALRDYPDTRILNLTSFPELIQQNYDELKGYWPQAPAGIYSAKIGRKQIRSQLLFAGIQSIHKKAYNLQKVDMVNVDEAHTIPRKSNTMYMRFLSDLLQINPNLKIIGYTATPFRADSGLLHRGEGAMFDDIAYEINIRELIDGGYLSMLTTQSGHGQINTDGVKIIAGEFNQVQLEAAAFDVDRLRSVADEIKANSEGRRGILYFGCGIGTCETMRDMFRERGISAECVFGTTPNAERRQIISAYKAGKIGALSLLGVGTTGFNAKHVDLIAVDRAIQALNLYVQIIGRGTRLFPGKDDCLILDFGGNIKRHGPIDKLTEIKEKIKKDGASSPVKACKICEASNPISARECSSCGNPFPDVEKILLTRSDKSDILSSAKQPASDPTWVDVSRVSYARHTKLNSPDSLRVTYQCGLLQHSEWILLQHDGGMKAKAGAWWRKRAQSDSVPASVNDALPLTRFLLSPKQIAVRPDGKWTRIVAHKFEDAA